MAHSESMLLMPALKKRLKKEASIGNLPSLEGILRDLAEYTKDPRATIAQISEHVARDPSLSVQLLRLSNSSYYARTEPVVAIEEAVLFLGVGQIRMLSMTTKCVDLLSPQGKHDFRWEDFWRHCVATAHFSFVLGSFFQRQEYSPELDYMAGLLHDVGKLVIAVLSPDGFGYIFEKAKEEKISFHQAERTYSDTDHAALGGWYLERQNLPSPVFEAVRCHHDWSLSVRNQDVSAIVNLADFLTRKSGVGCSGNMEVVSEDFKESGAWLFLINNYEPKQNLSIIEDRIQEETSQIEALVDSLLPPKSDIKFNAGLKLTRQRSPKAR